MIKNNQNLLTAIKYLIYATAITPAIVAGSFLFPYISPRTVYFRIILEIILLIFLFILILYKSKSKIKQQYFLYIFSGFIVINIISATFSFSPIVAWFSDTERMWGVFTLVHLFLFYFFLRAFFTGREWKILFNASLIVSLYVSLYGIFQYYPEIFNIEVFKAGKGRIISTLGNSAYVAIYTIFNAFFALFLLLKEKNNWLKYYYGTAILINLFAFSLANIRGTTLGLIAGVITTSLIYILLGNSKKYKIIIASCLILSSLLLFFSFLNPGKILKNNPLFQKISTISLHDSTVKTRLIGWNAAWQGFKEDPIFGVGMDNYNVVFNKYFDSDYYLYAPTEPYFDRSHNAWLDVLVMNGLVGFIIFLGFPFFIFYYLIKGYRQEKIKLDEFLVFTALSITYFVHLIFVFDDLNSYIYFVILIAFIEYRYYKNQLLEIKDKRSISLTNQYLIGGVAVMTIIIIAYTYNIKTMQAGNNVIKAMRNGNDLSKSIPLFDKAMEYNGVPSRNVVLSYVNYLAGLGGNLPAIKQNPQMHEAVKKAILNSLEYLDKEIKKDPLNAMLYSRQAVLDNIALFIFENRNYAMDAIAASEKAIELSPEHLQYYYTLADTHLILGDAEQAIKIVKQTIEINNRFNANYFHLARMYAANNQLEESLSATRLFVTHGYVVPQNNFFMALTDKFTEQGKNKEALEIMELALIHNKDQDILINLTRLYLKAGNNQKAIETLSDLAEFNKEIKNDVAQAINQINTGKSQELLKQLESN